MWHDGDMRYIGNQHKQKKKQIISLIVRPLALHPRSLFTNLKSNSSNNHHSARASSSQVIPIIIRLGTGKLTTTNFCISHIILYCTSAREVLAYIFLMNQSLARLLRRRPVISSLSSHLSTSTPRRTEQVVIKNSQRKFPIDIDLTRKHILKILEILQLPNFGVYLLICSDAKMREINKELRHKSKSTDILSYSLPEGVYDPISEMKMKEGHSYLGTLVICPAFVNRQLLADQEAFEVLVLTHSLLQTVMCSCNFISTTR